MYIIMGFNRPNKIQHFALAFTTNLFKYVKKQQNE